MALSDILGLDAHIPDGVYPDMDERDYRAQRHYVSTSNLKKIHCPSEFLADITGQAKMPDTDCLKKGRRAHERILEELKFIKSYGVLEGDENDGRTKAGKEARARMQEKGLIPLRTDESDMYEEIQMAFWNLPGMHDKYSDAMTEVSLFVNNFRHGIHAKCRIDMWDQKSGTVIDLKTTRPGGSSPYEFEKTSRRLKYHWQQASYTKMAARLGHEIKRWIWVVVEKAAPYTAAFYEFGPADVERANNEVNAAWDSLESCVRLNSWPSHTPNEPMLISLYGDQEGVGGGLPNQAA